MNILRISVLYHMTNMTILDILFFNFLNSTKSISSEAITPLKTISDDSIWCPKGHPSIPGKSQNLQFFRFWPCLVLMDSYVCSWDMLYVVWTQEMSSCGRRICLVVGEEYMAMEDVFLFSIYFGLLRVLGGAFFRFSKWIGVIYPSKSIF